MQVKRLTGHSERLAWDGRVPRRSHMVRHHKLTMGADELMNEWLTVEFSDEARLQVVR